MKHLDINIATVAALRAGLRIDQLAFACHSDEQEKEIMRAMGLEAAEWTVDECTAVGRIGNYKPIEGENTAKLMFNYDLGIEVEILRYLDGPNYLDLLGTNQGVCHIGMHVEKGTPLQDKADVAALFPFRIIQQVETRAHTNQFLLDSGRRYRYTIFDSTAILGTCLKVIERIELDEAA